MNKTDAEKQLQDWVAQVEASPFKALKTFVNTLRNWWQQILNYFKGRYTNGFAEGGNLKLKMLNRRGFGYRNFESFRLHVLVAFLPSKAKGKNRKPKRRSYVLIMVCYFWVMA